MTNQQEVECRINVTPLVDVVLVLLIIFMVVTPFLNNHPITVSLPRTPNPETKQEDSNRLVITIRDDTQVFWENLAVDQDQFEQRATELFQRKPSKEIVLRADRHLSYATPKKIMRSLSSAGFTNISVLSEKASVRH